MSEPKKLIDNDSRAQARFVRDRHWALMERIAREGTVHVCLWNKYGQEELPNEYRFSFCAGNQFMDWLRSHREWFEIGPQNKERWTNALSLTEAGRKALEEREKYDMEPVNGGLVAPGWQAIPLPRESTD